MYKRIVLSIILLLIIGGFYLLVSNPFRKIPPDGVPNDYFDQIEILSKLSIDITIYGKTVNLPKEIKYKEVDELSIEGIVSYKTYKFLIIDMSDIDSITHEELEVIKELYYEYCYNIFILELGNKYIYFDDLINIEDRGEKFIMLKYDICGGYYHCGSLKNPYYTSNQKQYAILDMMVRTIKDLNKVKYND